MRRAFALAAVLALPSFTRTLRMTVDPPSPSSRAASDSSVRTASAWVTGSASGLGIASQRADNAISVWGASKRTDEQDAS
jgi:hypothetical protein